MNLEELSIQYDFSEKADTDFVAWLDTTEGRMARKYLGIQVDEEADMTHGQRADLYNFYRDTDTYYEMVVGMAVDEDEEYYEGEELTND